jgi:polyisoprenoid-binding protein YceI
MHVRHGLSHAFALALVAAAASAAPLAIKGAAVSFSAKANVGMVIEGTTSTIAVEEDAKNVTLVVPLGTVTTGVELRDKHMKEKYLEVDKHPEAKLVIERACLALPEGGEKSGECPGAFTLHGQTKGVSVKYKATVAGKSTEIDASFTANFVDHGVEEPKYMGIKVKPAVDVKARFSAAR